MPQIQTMRNFLRWVNFTVSVALIGIAVAFALLFLGRLYIGLQQTAFVFSALMLYSIGVTIAAINYAAKLDAEAAARGGADRRLPVAPRARDRPDDA
ncbi:hypothetical protein IHQ68_17380 [Chelatococcus sambhunathii]|uniref:Uncharacterized protein n=1 Tax=Chelatococcus sambhunathii TaxID=363953 RepID=A0ABU1DJW8_9HYPH|nr:hypothetical protein [Chelatococcus sambhunathii]MDR4308394.1 hypothetical protein [Chelatococcus sambhunathii]